MPGLKGRAYPLLAPPRLIVRGTDIGLRCARTTTRGFVVALVLLGPMLLFLLDPFLTLTSVFVMLSHSSSQQPVRHLQLLRSARMVQMQDACTSRNVERLSLRSRGQSWAVLLHISGTTGRNA